MLNTGYFSKDDKYPYNSKFIHLLDGNNALCGYVPSPSLSTRVLAVGPELSYVTCARCVKAYERYKKPKKGILLPG